MIKHRYQIIPLPESAECWKQHPQYGFESEPYKAIAVAQDVVERELVDSVRWYLLLDGGWVEEDALSFDSAYVENIRSGVARRNHDEDCVKEWEDTMKKRQWRSEVMA